MAKRFSSASELDRLDRLARKHGLWILILLRPVPILAEGSTLLMGLSAMRWPVFLLGVGPVNLLISFFFVALGRTVPLLPAMAISVLAALMISYPVRKRLFSEAPSRESEES